MNPSQHQFPKSMQGFQDRGYDLPATTESFSRAALAGHVVKKASPNVKVIEPRGGIIAPMSKEKYNEASTDLLNMRKSGQAAAYGASVVEQREKSSFRHPLLKADKKTIKIKS